MIKFAIILTFASLGAFYILKVMGSFFINTQGVKSKIKDDLKALSKQLEDVVNTLSPWGAEDLELLSVTQAQLKKTPGIHTQMAGVVTNIYQEHLVAFAYKDYYYKKKKAILVARTSAHNFYYKITKKTVQVFRDNIHLGTLNANGSFFREDEEIANVDQSKTLNLIPISINNKQVASLVNPVGNAHQQARALKIIEPLNADEKELILSLSLFELISRTL